MLLGPALGREYNFAPLFLAVVASAYIGGFGSAIFALVLDCLIAPVLHGDVSPIPRTGSEAVGLFLYLLMGIGVGFVGESHQRSAAALTKQAAEIRESNEKLRDEMHARTRAQGDLEQSRAELAKANKNLEHLVEARTAELRGTISELEGFSYSIAHDMRVPLRAVNASFSLIEEEDAPHLSPTALEHLEIARKASLYMSHFIDDLLEHGRLSRVAIKLTETDLTELVETASRSLRRYEPSLEVELEPHATIVTDRNLVAVALEALIDNACKFRKKNSDCRVHIHVDREETETVIAVEDEGLGFDMQYERRIFEPFQKLSRDGTGTGIGLAKVQRIAERLHGRAWAVSKEGEGSTFFVSLPNEPGPTRSTSAQTNCAHGS